MPPEDREWEGCDEHDECRFEIHKLRTLVFELANSTKECLVVIRLFGQAAQNPMLAKAVGRKIEAEYGGFIVRADAAIDKAERITDKGIA